MISYLWLLFWILGGLSMCSRLLILFSAMYIRQFEFLFSSVDFNFASAFCSNYDTCIHSLCHILPFYCSLQSFISACSALSAPVRMLKKFGTFPPDFYGKPPSVTSPYCSSCRPGSPSLLWQGAFKISLLFCFTFSLLSSLMADTYVSEIT